MKRIIVGIALISIVILAFLMEKDAGSDTIALMVLLTIPGILLILWGWLSRRKDSIIKSRASESSLQMGNSAKLHPLFLLTQDSNPDVRAKAEQDLEALKRELGDTTVLQARNPMVINAEKIEYINAEGNLCSIPMNDLLGAGEDNEFMEDSLIREGVTLYLKGANQTGYKTIQFYVNDKIIYPSEQVQSSTSLSWGRECSPMAFIDIVKHYYAKRVGLGLSVAPPPTVDLLIGKSERNYFKTDGRTLEFNCDGTLSRIPIADLRSASPIIYTTNGAFNYMVLKLELKTSTAQHPLYVFKLGQTGEFSSTECYRIRDYCKYASSLFAKKSLEESATSA